MANNKFKQLLLDIETGGIDPSQSSILSAAIGPPGDIRSKFARPVAGTFLSRFSEEKIVPQLQRASSLSSERSVIESLISTLQQNPEATLAGYNIRGFDIGFIQRRAREYGLESTFKKAIGSRPIQDPVYQVKDIIASSIMGHAEAGTFQKELGGMSWSAAEQAFGNLPFKARPPEYNLISQISGYLKASRETAMFKGWKLEDVHKILLEHGAVGAIVGSAHEAEADLVMTSDVIQAARSGAMQSVFAQPSAAKQWMSIVKERGYHQFGAGRLLSQSDINELGLSRSIKIPEWMKNKKLLAGAGLTAALAYAVNKFSGKDDEYNSIEGLRHGGYAQSGRLQLTEFGSGWVGLLGKVLVNPITDDLVVFGVKMYGNRVSGNDDDHNTIEGLGHRGIAHHLRRRLTDFGSGWRGIVGYGEGIAKLLGRGGFQLDLEEGLSTFRKAIIQDATRFRGESLVGKGNPNNIRKETAQLLRSAREAKRAGKGSLIGIQRGFDWKSTGLDLRTTIYHERLHEQIAGSGLRKMQEIESTTLERSPFFIHEDKSVAGYASEAKAEERFVRVLEYIRSPKQYKQAMSVSTELRDRIPTPGEQQEALSIANKWDIRLSKRRGGKFTGKDDAYNTIEGLGHKGIAQKLRKMLTPFGSGWDALRNLTKAGESFETMLSSKEFRKAVAGAQATKVLGEGGLGKAFHMQGTFRGQSFNFVRKFGLIGENETATMKAFQHSFAPTVYGEGFAKKAGQHYVDMEMFEGKEFSKIAQEGKLTPEHVQKYEDALREMHSAGFVHGDAHGGNVILTNQGHVGIIDYGSSGVEGGTFGLKGRPDAGLHRPGGNVAKELQKNKMGGSIPDAKRPGGRTYGYYQTREKELDIVGIGAMRNTQMRSAHKAAFDAANEVTETGTYRDFATIVESKFSPTMRKTAQSDLQRAASSSNWKAGKNGGRRSRL